MAVAEDVVPIVVSKDLCCMVVSMVIDPKVMSQVCNIFDVGVNIVPVVVSKVFIAIIRSIVDCPIVDPRICIPSVDYNTRVVITRVLAKAVDIASIVVSKVSIAIICSIVDGPTVVSGVCIPSVDYNTRVVISRKTSKVFFHIYIVSILVSKVFIPTICSIADGPTVVSGVCIPGVDNNTRVVISRITTKVFFHIYIVSIVVSKVFIPTICSIADGPTVVPSICIPRVADETGVVIPRVTWLLPKDIVTGDTKT